MYRDIYNEKAMPKGINKPVTSTFSKKLWSGVVEGYGKDLGDVAYDSPDYNMLANLQKNVYAFSAAKNWQQMKAITQALVSDDGKGLKTWSEFRVAANDITGEHLRWLKVEYDTAIAGGQMAGKWVGIEANKGSLPMLEFDAVMDRRTSALCSSLNGVVRSVDDSFWNQYYPPNHFGCRSTVRQRSGGMTATPLDRIEYPEKMPEMFNVNLASQGLIYPPNHNYWNAVPQEVLSFGDANYKLDTLRELKGTPGRVFESGMAFNQSKLNDRRYYDEYNMRMEVADVLATHFKDDVYITPEFANTDWRYSLFFKGAPVPGTLPDYVIGKHFWELESYEKAFKYGKISKMLRNGALQSDRIILKLNHKADIENIRQRAMGSLQKSPHLKNVKSVIVIDKYNNVYLIK